MIESGVMAAKAILMGMLMSNGPVDNSTVEIDSDVLRVKDLGITDLELNANSVITSKINNGAVTTDKLDTDAVTNAKLSDNAVQTENILDNAVTNAKLDDNAVQTDNILENQLNNHNSY